MVVTAGQALAVANLNRELAIQELKGAQDADTLNRLNEFIAVLTRQVEFWEDRVAAEKAKAAEG